LHRVVVTLDII